MRNCRFIAEIMFCLIHQVLRLLKMRCGLSKHLGCFIINVCWHDFAFSTHEFCYRPYNFHFNILNSFEIIAKTLSVALEVSLSIFSSLCVRRLTIRVPTRSDTNWAVQSQLEILDLESRGIVLSV